MRRKVVVAAVLAAALVGVVGADIIKTRDAGLPKGTVTVENIESIVVTASRLDNAPEQLPVVATAM